MSARPLLCWLRLLFASSCLLLLLLRIPAAKADHDAVKCPSNITLKAAVIPGDTFGDFQKDLLERLVVFAREDNVTLNFDKRDVQEEYTGNLALIAPDCHPGESAYVNDVEYDCSEFDMIVGDYWTSPSRYTNVDFTPPWLHTSISALKYVEKTKYPQLDVTTLTQASVRGAGVCIPEGTYIGKIVAQMFPRAKLVPCAVDDTDSPETCIRRLKAEECMLWVSDELVLRRRQAEDPSLEMTGEHLQRQFLAWPVRRSLDPTVSYLLNKWIYAAISNQTIADLYFEYFEKKQCPIGTSGKHCELPCDPDHGVSNAAGKCVCESTRWTGEDCSIEVQEYLNMIPSTVEAIAYTMLGVNLWVILICAIWLYWQRNSSEVQVSSPLFLGLVLLGCLISSSTIIAMTQEHEGDGPVPACMAIPWLYSVGFSVTFGTLFAKILRVYRLFTQVISVTGRNAVTARDTLKYIGAVLLLDVIILVLWTAMDPLEWHRITTREDVFGSPLESHGYCTSDSWKIFASLIGALHLGLMAIASWMCFRARNIPTRYSEHKYVSIAMISNLQIFVVGVPVLVIVAGDPDSMLFVRSVIVWMNDLVVVTLIFGNLMHSVHVSSKGSLASSDDNKAEIEVAVRQYSFSPPSTRGNSKTPQTGVPAEPSLSEMSLPPMMSSNTRRPAQISSLSIGSASTTKKVSFAEEVILSEIPLSEYDEEDGSQRFVVQGIQGAPMKPRRSSADEPMTKPERPSTESEMGAMNDVSCAALYNSDRDSQRRYSLDSGLSPPHIEPITMNPFRHSFHIQSHSDRVWHTGPVQNSPFKPRRRSLEDSTMIQPTRQPSEHVDDSESSFGDDGAKMLQSLPLAFSLSTTNNLDEARLPHNSAQPSGQSTGQVSRLASQSSAQSEGIAQTLPRQPVRLNSIAELEPGSNSSSSSSSCEDSLEEPKLEASTIRRSRESSRGSEQVQPAPTKPVRLISTTDLASDDSSSDEAAELEVPTLSRVCNRGSRASLELVQGAATKPSRVTSNDSFNLIVDRAIEAPPLDRDTSRGSTNSKEHIQGAPAQPLRVLSTTDLESDDSSDEDAVDEPQHKTETKKSFGVSTSSTTRQAQGAPTIPLRIDSTCETDSYEEKLYPSSNDGTARTLEDSSTSLLHGDEFEA